MPRAILTLPIADISELEEGGHVGLVDVSAVECLKARLAVEGLLNPIWVRKNAGSASKPWSVIAGRHRLIAAIKLGWSEIAAEERAGANSGTAELRKLQLAENLDRRVLRAIERSCFVMERWMGAASTTASAPATTQQARASRARWSALATVANALKVDEAVAVASGTTARTIRRDRELHTALVIELPEHFARLNAHNLGASFKAMRELAKLPLIERLQVAQGIIDNPNATSVDEVRVALALKDSNGKRSGRTEKFVTAYKQMSLVDRRITFLRLAKEVPPTWLREAVEDAPGKLGISPSSSLEPQA